MRHNLSVEGHAFRLRPVEIDDAAFILELRLDPQRNRYLHRGATNLREQQAWIEQYFDCPGDYYFVVENRATRALEGTAGIYNLETGGNLDPAERTAEWGRWIVRSGSLAALESACMVYTAAFDLLDLESLTCRTILENASAVAFHDSFGVERIGVLPCYFDCDGRLLDAVEGRLTRTRWNTLRENALAKAARAAAWSLDTRAYRT